MFNTKYPNSDEETDYAMMLILFVVLSKTAETRFKFHSFGRDEITYSL